MIFAKSMECPRCQSRYTQSVEMAYSQSVRTGESGYTTISEFGRSLTPPAPRSAIAFPLALAFSVAVVSIIVLPVLGTMLPIKWLEGLESFDKPVIVGSAILGTIAGLRSAISALVYNESVHRGDMYQWARAVVCRRCGYRFTRRQCSFP